MSRIAVIQKAPSLLDRERTMCDAVAAVDEASRSGAELVVFPETFIPGYPVWIWRLRPGTDAAIIAKLHSRLVSNAVDVSRGDLKPLCEAAKRNKVSVVCGIEERDHDTSRGTLYNAVVLVGTDGAIIAKHRKLMPTNVERTVWGFGDGSSVNVVDTPCGRVGALICWESYMPLARFALYAQGIELYIAGPMRREVGILYADVSIDAVVAAKRRIDVAGHYARPDVFQLHVNRQRQAPVTFD